jgi:hypothetical protein
MGGPAWKGHPLSLSGLLLLILQAAAPAFHIMLALGMSIGVGLVAHTELRIQAICESAGT